VGHLREGVNHAEKSKPQCERLGEWSFPKKTLRNFKSDGLTAIAMDTDQNFTGLGAGRGHLRSAILRTDRKAWIAHGFMVAFASLT